MPLKNYHFILFFFLILPHITQAAGLKYYGVDFAYPDDYADLNNKGNVTLVSSNGTTPGEWQYILDTAVANGQKVLIYIHWQESQICQGSAAWNWNGSNWELNNWGTTFLDFIAGYIKSGGQGFFALYTLHEPFNTWHSPNCTPTVQKNLYTLLKQEAQNRGLTSEQLPLFADVDRTDISGFTAELCDYCGTFYYPNGECNTDPSWPWNRKVDSCLDKLKADYQSIVTQAPNSTLVVKAQSFGYGGSSSYVMPSAAELEYFGKRVIADLKAHFNKPYVFMWYVWVGTSYPYYLKNSPGGESSYQVLKNVYPYSVTSLPGNMFLLLEADD